MQDEKMRLNHMEDIKKRGLKTGCGVSKFLTPAEIQMIQMQYQKDVDIALQFHGGFSNAERQVAVMLQPDWGSFIPEEHIAAIAFTYRKQDALSHRDILGAILASGLSRDMVGDILCMEGKSIVICLASIAAFILSAVDRIARVGVKAELISLAHICEKPENLREVTDTVASFRLDCIISAAFRISRGDAAAYIRAGKVQLSHAVCLETNQLVKIHEIFSLRGFGRGKLLQIGGTSRKNRSFITIGIYE